MKNDLLNLSYLNVTGKQTTKSVTQKTANNGTKWGLTPFFGSLL